MGWIAEKFLTRPLLRQRFRGWERIDGEATSQPTPAPNVFRKNGNSATFCARPCRSINLVGTTTREANYQLEPRTANRRDLRREGTDGGTNGRDARRAPPKARNWKTEIDLETTGRGAFPPTTDKR
jgi:hypothetical protein